MIKLVFERIPFVIFVQFVVSEFEFEVGLHFEKVYLHTRLNLPVFALAKPIDPGFGEHRSMNHESSESHE
jgi:hypothetical protein